MKKFLTSTFFLLAIFSCKKETTVETAKVEIAAVTPELAENGVIYEANIRQYSPEGTFNEFTKDIPKLKIASRKKVDVKNFFIIIRLIVFYKSSFSIFFLIIRFQIHCL